MTATLPTDRALIQSTPARISRAALPVFAVVWGAFAAWSADQAATRASMTT